MNKVLRSFLKRLTNLTSNNKSLFMPRLSHADLDLHEFDYVNGNPSFSLIRQLLKGEKQVSLCKVVDDRNAKANELSKKLKILFRKDRMVLEERGSQDLYVAWPFVHGKLQDGTIMRCPLLFFPVLIREVKNDWLLLPRKDIGISFNKSFLIAYAHFNQVRLEDEFLDLSFEDFDTDSRLFITSLYELIKSSPLELHFNQSLFDEKLNSFVNLKKQSCEESFSDGVLKLFPEAVLGMFPQSGSFLVPDYEFLLEQNISGNIEELFLKKEEVNVSGVSNDYKLKEEQTFTPFALDASQEAAIRAVKSGNSIVVQGPPGTGKSQLICNLICDYIARGKKVLVVCQKRAALDVVYARLQELGIANFLSLVHDFKSDRSVVFSKIAEQVALIEQYKKENNSLEAVQEERQFIISSRKIDSLVQELTVFKNALFETSSFGISVKELYLTSNFSDKQVDLAEHVRNFDIWNVEQFMQKIQAFYRYEQRVNGVHYVWKDRHSFADLDHQGLHALLKLLPEVYKVDKHFEFEFWQHFSIPKKQFKDELFFDTLISLEEILLGLENDQVYKFFKAAIENNVSTECILVFDAIFEKLLLKGWEESITSDNLEDAIKIFGEAEQAYAKNILQWTLWKLISGKSGLLKRLFQLNNFNIDRAGFAQLGEKLKNRKLLERELEFLKQNGITFPDTRKINAFLTWYSILKKGMHIKSIFLDIPFAGHFLPTENIVHEYKAKVFSFIHLVKNMKEETAKFQMLLHPKMIRKLVEVEESSHVLQEILRRDFDLLCAYDKFLTELVPYELSTLEKLSKCFLNAAEAVAGFNNSIRCQWIIEIEKQHPMLRSVTSFKMEETEADLQQHIQEKGSISRKILASRIREQVYKSNSFNRLNNRITYRELNHQITKKKKIWPLRKIVENFSDELFTLIPCWLASPESVSAIFPMKEQFDLVVVDEASQCFTEKGIPAIFRGKQLVITGDSKQLRPNDIYQTRFEEEDVPAEAEIESLLDLGQQYLQEFHLLQHYRSRVPELIEFSNQQFYKGKLEMLPDRNFLNKKETAIEYIKVDGRWENGVNKEEAYTVLGILKKLISENKFSVGIITFNYKQAELIQDLVENSAMAEGFIVPKEIFFKNIENVQGDERDIVVFSTGYAPDGRGRMAMHFGSLNQDGGENRLNVAVTRARDKIYLVTSIFPAQLEVSGSLHEGPKVFKNFMEYAQEVAMVRKNTKTERSYKDASWYLTRRLQQEIYYEKSVQLSNSISYVDMEISAGNLSPGLMLTDDEKYHKSISVKDYHAYRPVRLKELNWKYLKLYSRNFWENKIEMISSIISLNDNQGHD